MSNRPSSSFGATDQRVYVVNNRVPVFDYNTEQIKLDLSNNVVPILTDISNALGNLDFNGSVEVSGNVNLAPNTLVGLTGPYIYGGYIGVTGNFGSVTVNAVEISGNVNLNPNTKVGLTGSFIYGDYIGVTGSFQSGPISIASGQYVGITGGVTGSLSVNNFPSSFSISGGVTGTFDINGVTGVNGKLPTYDASANYAINNHSIKAMIDDGTGTFIMDNVQGNINNVGLNSISVYNYDLDVKLTSDPGVTAAIQTTVKNTVGVTGFVGISSMPAITVSANQFIGITGTALVKDISGNALLTTIESDISGGVLVKGQDDTGVRYPFYVDANGIQRTEVVPGHIESATYIFETDIGALAPVGTSAWSLDVRGRPGYYFGVGTSAANTSLSWYGNNGISFPPTINFNDAQAIYAVICCDITFLDLPKLKITTSASVWEYTIAGTIYNGESYLFYYGQKAIALNPQYHPKSLTRTKISGPGLNGETIVSITVEATASTGQFLVNRAGIWDQSNQQRFETIFETNKPLTVENNLASLNFDGSGNLQVSIENTPTVGILAGTTVGLTGLAKIADSSGNSITSTQITVGGIRGLDTTSYLNAFNENTTAYSPVNCSNITTTGYDTVLLNVNPVTKMRPAGSRGNILNNVTISSYGISSTISILDAGGSRIYGRYSFISYEDASPSSTNEICIFGIDSGGGAHAILPSALPVALPTVSTGVLINRVWSSTVDLSPFVSLLIKNNGFGSLTGVYVSVLTGSSYSN